jgi:A/G-specific adenine glycosylase
VPTTAWLHDFDERRSLDDAPQFAAKGKPKWRRMAGVVRHVFTHFPLELAIYAAELPVRTPAPSGTRWAKISELPGEALPSLMRKVVAHVLSTD